MAARKEPRDWRCMDCGKRMTLKQAERCAFAADIELVPQGSEVAQ